MYGIYTVYTLPCVETLLPLLDHPKHTIHCHPMYNIYKKNSCFYACLMKMTSHWVRIKFSQNYYLAI